MELDDVRHLARKVLLTMVDKVEDAAFLLAAHEVFPTIAVRMITALLLVLVQLHDFGHVVVGDVNRPRLIFLEAK